ncbi:hypothetical protein [Streptococcus dentiloxodontae]
MSTFSSKEKIFLFLIWTFLLVSWFTKAGQSILTCTIFHAIVNHIPGTFEGMIKAMAYGELKQIQPFYL